MKKYILFVAVAMLPLSAMAFESVIGNTRIVCNTSYPRSGEGLGHMIEELVSDQAKAGYTKNTSTTATKVGWLDQQSDNGEVAVCVTASKK